MTFVRPCSEAEIACSSGLPRLTERDSQLLRVLLLPAGDVREHRRAGAAVRVGEQQDYRLSGGAQRLQGERLALEVRKLEVRGRFSERQSGREFLREPVLEGFYAHREQPVLPEQAEQELPLGDHHAEHRYTNAEAQELGRREAGEPTHRAGSGTAVAPPDHEAGHGGEDPFAHKGLPAGGF